MRHCSVIGSNVGRAMQCAQRMWDMGARNEVEILQGNPFSVGLLSNAGIYLKCVMPLKVFKIL